MLIFLNINRHFKHLHMAVKIDFQFGNSDICFINTKLGIYVKIRIN